MINNRQGGRRRGRGGQRNPNLGGNRQDNRQRGNAAQLLEKYKNMARDAQLAGDRVQAEYYLQFADHYFRVLGENRPRFDEQRPQRDDSSDEDEGDEQMAEASDDEQQQQSNDRGERAERNERPERSSRSDRGERNDRGPRGNGRERPQRNGSQLAEAEPEIDDERIALEVLPPAIGRDSDDEGEAPAKPRRRVRKVRNDGDEADIAPAA
ncbi:DUF4167 domain-containing protein [Sphingomonas sp. RG327]|uniref:DUF4167 domain-containing protein n=1 Tax=Sphingomonas anseongensis TaxID=2908207 RepID=A0ABT0RG03_9SPHN|nr:DUF4167 domain-containing protein [Sphingomonas anseongensis]MCL6679212.1 DUF4167 domain-containing protein [Sphingomonas anseongensis]